MLAAGQRLRHTDAFRRTVRSGRRAGGAALVVHLLDAGAEPAGSPQVGFVVGKTVGGAVVRNRVKRRLRHLVKNHMTTLPPSSTVVVRALPATASMSSAELEAELTRSLRRVATAPQATRAGAATGAGTRAEP
ncbi:MAG TPA: ribonuclease P protein component [Nocardioides sp.]|uniref:ribonuclease P protein component n=1 Tax=Nocardioides sp. TaxID=35761 RepID=UPI002E368661|nr:ribonuclease P protein component [Nocardioides sp.]HEX5090070.1 ribonuclease P protein component [Nocardioides sp.]